MHVFIEYQLKWFWVKAKTATSGPIWLYNVHNMIILYAPFEKSKRLKDLKTYRHGTRFVFALVREEGNILQESQPFNLLAVYIGK